MIFKSKRGQLTEYRSKFKRCHSPNLFLCEYRQQPFQHRHAKKKNQMKKGIAVKPLPMIRFVIIGFMVIFIRKLGIFCKPMQTDIEKLKKREICSGFLNFAVVLIAKPLGKFA